MNKNDIISFHVVYWTWFSFIFCRVINWKETTGSKRWWDNVSAREKKRRVLHSAWVTPLKKLKCPTAITPSKIKVYFSIKVINTWTNKTKQPSCILNLLLHEWWVTYLLRISNLDLCVTSDLVSASGNTPTESLLTIWYNKSCLNEENLKKFFFFLTSHLWNELSRTLALHFFTTARLPMNGPWGDFCHISGVGAGE